MKFAAISCEMSVEKDIKYCAVIRTLGRAEQAKYWMYESIDESLRNSFYGNDSIGLMLKRAEAEVLAGRKSSFVAAAELLNSYFALLH